jgi:hypothetical protein
MIKSRRAVILLAFIIGLCSCSRSNDTTLFEKVSSREFNVFKIKRTEFTYRGDPIFTIDIPYSGLYSAFVQSNYLLISNNVVNEISLYPNCISYYKSGNYEIKEFKKEAFKNYNECDIFITPIVDFSLKLGERKVYLYSHWLELNRKFYDRELEDTVYQFTRNERKDEGYTVINASKRDGFVGIYELVKDPNNANYIQNPVGKIYASDTTLKSKYLKLREPSVRLDLVKEFSR